jgi:hypothetical protein
MDGIYETAREYPMSTYRSLTDALSAAREGYKETEEPEAMLVSQDNGSYSVSFKANRNDALASQYTMGFWGDLARQSYSDNDYAVNTVLGREGMISGRYML